MQMRVAFAVATAKRPEILIVDEALSVGDSYFQHKSFDRIREFQDQGTTLLIVSHDRSSIQALCDRVLLIEGGTVIKDGAPEEVMDFYNAIISEKENATVQVHKLADGSVQTRSGSGEATIESLALYNEVDAPVEFVSVGQSLSLKIKVSVNSPIPELVVGYMIKDRLGQPIYGTNTHHLDKKMGALEGGTQLEYVFRFDANIGVGSYSIAVALHTADTHLNANYEWRDLALVFNVINADKIPFVGSAWIQPTVECIQ
jgi:lipopolysaccharide transport system ATP-binding protein